MESAHDAVRGLVAASLIGLMTAAVVGSCEVRAPLWQAEPTKVQAPSPVAVAAPPAPPRPPLQLGPLAGACARERSAAAPPAAPGAPVLVVQSVVPDLWNTFRWSPQSQLFASVEGSGTALIWDGATGELRGALAAPSPSFEFTTYSLQMLAWSPDGSELAGIGHHVLMIWSLATGAVRREWPINDEDRPLSLVWSVDGAVIATVGTENRLRAWNPKTGALLADHALLPVVSGWQKSPRLAWSPDGASVAINDGNGKLFSWDTATGALRHRLDVPAGSPGVAFKPDGSTPVAVDHDTSERSPLLSCDGHALASFDRAWPTFRAAAAGAPPIARRIESVSSEDGTALVTTMPSGAAVVFDTRTLALRAALEQTGPSQPGGPPEDETYEFVLGGKSILGKAHRPGPHAYLSETVLRVWDATTGHLQGKQELYSSGLLYSWSPDGRTLGIQRQVYGSANPSGFELFHVAGLAPIGVADSPRVVYQHDWSPDSSALAVVSWEPARSEEQPEQQKTIQIRDAATGALRVRIDPWQFGPASHVRWMPDSASVVIAHRIQLVGDPDRLDDSKFAVDVAGPASVWDARTGALRDVFPSLESALASAPRAPLPPAAFTIHQAPEFNDPEIVRSADGARVTLHVLRVGPGVEVLATTKEGLFDGDPALVRFRLGPDLIRAPLVAATKVPDHRRRGLVADLLAGKPVSL